MGILDAYDKYGTPVITPDKVYDTKIRRADTCVVTFSHNVLEKVLDKFNHIVAGQIGSANGIADVYYLPELPAGTGCPLLHVTDRCTRGGLHLTGSAVPWGCEELYLFWLMRADWRHFW